MIYAYLPLPTLVIIWDIYKKLSTSFTCIPHVQELTVVSRGYKCLAIITNEVWGKLQENERFEMVWSAATWLNRKNVCWEVFPEEKNNDGLLRFISKRHIAWDQMIIWFIIHLRNIQCGNWLLVEHCSVLCHMIHELPATHSKYLYLI